MDGSRQKPGRSKSRQSIAHTSSQSNTTTDIAALKRSIDAQDRVKRQRGKSLGPGGLEALTETSANVFKIPPSYQPRSILKTSILLTPPKNIPSFDELRQKSSIKPKSPVKNDPEDLLIDFSTPGPSREAAANGHATTNGNVLDPFSPIRPRNVEEQKALPGQDGRSTDVLDEEEQKRLAEKERRAARRKSLANRRVSFAPEATLHTWSVMELLEDSTTSSGANSTRRQSSMTAAQFPAPPVLASEESTNANRPSTADDQPLAGPAADVVSLQQETDQQKRRRSSDSAHSSDDETFSSAGDEADSSPVRVEESIDSESDTDGDTAMSLDEATANSVRSSGSSSTQTSLDERLRQAANQAGTRGIDYDENGSEHEDDQSMEIVDGTVTHAFKPYATTSYRELATNVIDDKENLNSSQSDASVIEDEYGIRNDETTLGITMEMTRAVGGIVSSSIADKQSGSPAHKTNKLSRRLSSHGNIILDDESMDLTVAKGYILEHDDSQQDESGDEASSDEDMTMEMTMEMTKAVDGIRNSFADIHSNSQFADQTEAMDMTLAAGGILPPIEEQTEPQTGVMDDMTGAMDMTHAVGKILGSATADASSASISNIQDRQMTPASRSISGSTQNISSSTKHRQMATVTSETGSPTLQPRSSARRKPNEKNSTTPRSPPKRSRKTEDGQTTPSKQFTPAPQKSVSPSRTPVLTGITHRSASPKKLFAKELRTRASPATKKSPQRQTDLLFSRDQTTGLHTPRVVLHAPKPHQHLQGRRKVIDVDDGNLGSPRVSEILSRRTSISDVAPSFELPLDQDRTLSLEDPREIARQVDFERAEEQRRESGRFVMEQEADGQEVENTTQNLKDMIESMTPKKDQAKKYKGRKSLAVGSARGLLGKRPAELDLDEDDGDNMLTAKRLRIASREASPVKKVHLPRPPTKEETTGRLSRAETLQLATMVPSIGTPVLNQSPVGKVKSPERTGHFKQLSPEKPSSFERRLDNVFDAIDIATTHPNLGDAAEQDEEISLQQFLNMTNIHFIELSTTKRRHTKAFQSSDIETEHGTEYGSCVTFVASTTTLPLLDLYQHATRELKSYISSGRQIIRTIEDETLKEQPQIFRKYVDADPGAKLLFDNQFRNSKTNARLQSKESWYAWRSQLVDGLQSGLQGILQDAKHDGKVLSEQEQALGTVLPQIRGRKAQLKHQLTELRQRVLEFENTDHEALKMKRERLAASDRVFTERVEYLKQLQEQMEEKDEVLSQAVELRQEMSDQIEEIVRVQEKQTRWPSKDVNGAKERVEKLEAQSGWRLLTAEGSSDEVGYLGTGLTMQYGKKLTLFFYPSAYRSGGKLTRRRSGRSSRSVSGPSAPIRLTYSSDDSEEQTQAQLPTETRFSLQILQSQLQGFAMLPKGSIGCQQLLKTVSDGWPMACKIAEEIRQLNTVGMVHVHIQSDEQLVCSLKLLQPGRSRIDVRFALTVQALDNGEFSVTTSVAATPIYGSAITVIDAFKLRKVQHALSKEVGSRELGEGSWKQAIRGFEEWLSAQMGSTGAGPPSRPTGIDDVESIPTTGTTKREDEPTVNSRPAVTHSPRGTDTVNSMTPKIPPRSPLAPRTTNRILKKTIPVPKKPVNFSQSQNAASEFNPMKMREASMQKENVMPSVGEVKSLQDESHLSESDVFGIAKPAITPAEQEAMMHTPVKKRVGALRRSPI